MLDKHAPATPQDAQKIMKSRFEETASEPKSTSKGDCVERTARLFHREVSFFGPETISPPTDCPKPSSAVGHAIQNHNCVYKQYKITISTRLFHLRGPTDQNILLEHCPAIVLHICKYFLEGSILAIHVVTGRDHLIEESVPTYDGAQKTENRKPVRGNRIGNPRNYLIAA